ncbi:MAG TPA: FHA domain-containing protein [Polyangiaceae bacterium]|nr:FHA domain-containing protein [Polyangiaceae bacterium]
MVQSISAARAAAARVAAWLVDKGRPDEAVGLIAAWAANGPNDAEGQQLLAQALRIDPSAPVAQQAFERMEGVAGEQVELAQCITRFGAEALQRLEAEMGRPSFRRAQIGFNNNIKSHDQVFHVQTEDSGLDQPHIVTHLFADGGRVIKSHKRSYEAELQRPNISEWVRSLMKAQHLEMVLGLREGRFDEVIAGRARGGLEVLIEPPNVENIRKLTNQKKQRAEASAAAVTDAPEPARPPPKPLVAATAEPVPPAPKKLFALHVLRSLSGGPLRYEPLGESAVIGVGADIGLPGERFCAAKEARLQYRQGRLWLEDLEGSNGIFLRIRGPVELELGDEFVVGDQLLRIEQNPVADDGPDPDPTYFYSSPKWPSSFRVVQVFEGGAPGFCVLARGNTLQIGSAIGDVLFPDDPLVSEQHCLIEEHAGTVVLTDLLSRTGVFVRIRGEQELAQGDELLVGRTRLVIDLVRPTAA